MNLWLLCLSGQRVCLLGQRAGSDGDTENDAV